jgi:hypothetical protein
MAGHAAHQEPMAGLSEDPGVEVRVDVDLDRLPPEVGKQASRVPGPKRSSAQFLSSSHDAVGRRRQTGPLHPERMTSSTVDRKLLSIDRLQNWYPGRRAKVWGAFSGLAWLAIHCCEVFGVCRSMRKGPLVTLITAYESSLGELSHVVGVGALAEADGVGHSQMHAGASSS